MPQIQMAHAGQVGEFTVVKGSVDASRELTDAPIPAQIGMGILIQDIIRTKHRSRTRLKLIDNSVLNMGQDYMMQIDEYVFDADKKVRKGVIRALRGKVRATVAKIGDGGDNSRFEIYTPTAIAAARGTEFIVNVDSSLKSEIIVLEGIVAVKNINPLIKGEVLVGVGQYTSVVRGQPPALPTYMPPAQVQLMVNDTTASSSPSNSSGSLSLSSTQAGTGSTGRTKEGAAPTTTTQAIADVAPVPPPPLVAPPPSINPSSILVQGHIATGLPPAQAQPAITQTVPGILSVPVNLILVF